MRNIWFTSDQHYGHSNILKFTDNTGNKVRTFDSVDQMNQEMIDKHNEVVKDNDLIYFLGDVSLHRATYHQILPKLKGTKRLILGNHDCFKISEYSQYFQDISAVKRFREYSKHFICSHYPIHEYCLFKASEDAYDVYNVHGHIHTMNINDKRYINICVEQTNYRPLHIDELLELMK